MDRNQIITLKENLQNETLDFWLQSSPKNSIKEFLDILFTEDIDTLGLLMDEDKNDDITVRALVIIIELPHQTLNLLRGLITKLLLRYLTYNNTKAIDNILWLSGHTKNCCDSLYLFSYLQENDISLENQKKMSTLLIGVDFELANTYIELCYEKSSDDEFLSLKLENFADNNPFQGIEYFIEMKPTNPDSFFISILELPVKEILLSLIKANFPIGTLKSKLASVKERWKLNVISQIVYSESELSVLEDFKLQARNESNFLEASLLSLEHQLFINNTIFSWQTIVKSIVGILKNQSLELEPEVEKKLANIFLNHFRNNISSFNKYLTNDCKAFYDPAKYLIRFNDGTPVIKVSESEDIMMKSLREDSIEIISIETFNEIVEQKTTEMNL